MPGIAFDRAANYYDSTRGYPPGVAERIRDAIVSLTQTSTQTRFLELGVGTGRIALPFIRAGYDYTGIDLSQPMMDQLTSKLSSDINAQAYHYRLLRGDIIQLPFADASFDVTIAVHVLHLVNGWQAALGEAQRVLRHPGGWLLISRDTYHGTQGNKNESARHLVNKQWDSILKDYGATRDELLPGIGRSGQTQQIETYLHELGAETQQHTLVEYEEQPLSPREMVERHRERQYSADWLLSDEVYAQAIHRLDTWLENDCPEPDRPRSSPAQFQAIVAH